MQGSCLCGEVVFEIDVPSAGVIQCHCKLCRKQGGSASNTATFVPTKKFSWQKGEDAVGTWKSSSGFRSDFCRHCGSPVPNPLKQLDLVWIPVGLLDDDQGLRVVAHIYTDSKASWDPSALVEQSFTEMPSVDELLKLMHGTQGA